MTKDLSIGIVQTGLFWEDIDANLSHFEDILQKLSDEYHIVILPEMFTTGFTMNSKKSAEPINGKTTRWMMDMAKLKGFALAGSIIIMEKGKYFNRFLFATPSGMLFQYDKRHLFSLGDEHLQFSNGTKRVVFEYLGWRILPQICYDLRFPVWSWNCNDYDLMINVANFPGTRRVVWNTLIKARAIENQCFVAAANRIGTDGMKISYTGDSQLVNAKGQIIARLKQDEDGVVSGTFNYDELMNFRKKFPILSDADDFTISF